MNSPLRLAAAIVGSLVLALSACTTLAPQQPPPRPVLTSAPASAIYIGNSFFYYNNSMHGKVRAMVSEGLPGHKFRSTSVTISGAGLDWHDVDSYFRPDGIGKYSFAAGNKVVFNKIEGPLFEVAIMMDCSQCPIHPQLAPVFHEYAKKDSDIVRKHGGVPALFMSWAYADKPEMTRQLADAYTAAGKEYGALVIPAGQVTRHQAGRRALGVFSLGFSRLARSHGKSIFDEKSWRV